GTPSNQVSFATMPVPSEADYCAKGGNFGPHNLWENRPGAFQSSRFIFATYHNAGVRVFDIENPFQPREAGYFVPPDPERMFDPRPNRPKVIQSADCFVDAQGVMYLTDNNAGLYILQFAGPERGSLSVLLLFARTPAEAAEAEPGLGLGEATVESGHGLRDVLGVVGDERP